MRLDALMGVDSSSVWQGKRRVAGRFPTPQVRRSVPSSERPRAFQSTEVEAALVRFSPVRVFPIAKA